MGDTTTDLVRAQEFERGWKEFSDLINVDGTVFLAFAERLGKALKQKSSLNQKLGNSSKRSARLPGGDVDEWNIRAVLRGDGSIGTDGNIMEKGKIFASSAMRGGTELFWEVNSGSLRLCYQVADIMRWPAVAVTTTARERHGSRRVNGPIVDFRKMNEARKRLLVLQELIKWAKANQGVAVLVGGPGERPPSKTLRQYYVREKRIQLAVPAGRCLDGAIAHAISCLLDDDAGSSAFSELMGMSNRIGVISLKCTRDILHKLSAKVETRKLTRREKAEMQGNAFQWLSEHATGIWIVRVVQSGILDHCFCVDTSRALIFDAAKEYPLRLLEEVLRQCGGEDARKLKFAEAVRVVEQQKKSNHNVKRRRLE